MSRIGTFFAELRRRKVWLVGGIYLFASWIVIQVVIAAEASLGLPPWVDTLIFVLAAAGFPLVLILAWAQEIQAGAPEPDALPAVDVAPDVDGKSLAVLPFENLSPDPDNAYFAAGIHEEVLNQLAKIRDLDVIARTSVQQYLKTRKTIPEIARELSVANVMEGSVRYAGDRVRVTAQLIDGVTNKHLWSETFDRVIEDVFGIQSDIALGIASALRATLTDAETQSVRSKPTENAEAYAAYLRGLASFGVGDLEAALEKFDRAAVLDPNYSDALASKAGILAIASEFRVFTVPEDAIEQALLLSERAAKLDPTSGMALWARGTALRKGKDWPLALPVFQRAAELAPGDSRSFIGLALQLASMKRLPEAAAAIERAIELDPAFSVTHYQASRIYYLMGRMQDALLQAEILIRIAAAAPFHNLMLPTVLIALGRHEDARASLRPLEKFLHDTESQLNAFIAVNWAMLGDREKAHELGREVDWPSTSIGVKAAWALHTEGPEQAIELLEAEFEEAGNLSAATHLLPELSALYSHPRYLAMMKKMGLEQ